MTYQNKVKTINMENNLFVKEIFSRETKTKKINIIDMKSQKL